MQRRNYYSFFLLFIITITATFASKDRLVVGKVIDASKGDAIGGATIKIIGSGKGVYSSGSGAFRLQMPDNCNSLKVSSIGYESKTVEIKSFRDTLIVRLKAGVINVPTTTAVGDINADEVVRRAIAKRDENEKKIKTFNGLLYSKMVMELDGSIASSASAGAGSLSISASPNESKAKAEAYKMFVMETFSKYYVDKDKNIKKTYIQQRNQTGNMPADANLLALSEFNDFFQSKIVLFDATFITPMHPDSRDYYDFKIVNKTLNDDRYIYLISVEPKSKLYPLFKGTISIVEGTYNLINIDLSPSESSAVMFVENLNFKQKFDEVTPGIWYPGLFEVSARAKVEILKGVYDLGLNFKATAIFHEAKVNEALPDSIYKSETPNVVVDAKADSAGKQFWEENSLREISPRELEMYKQIDTAVKKLDTIQAQNKKFTYDIMPTGAFNRVFGYGVGAKLDFSFFSALDLQVAPIYSFGQKKLYGEVKLSSSFNTGGIYMKPKLELFSGLTNQGTNDYPRLVTDVIALLTHKDYYDYSHKEGLGLGFDMNYKRISLKAGFESADHKSLDIYGDQSLFFDSKWRDNPKVAEGKIRNFKLGLAYENGFSSFYSDGAITYSLSADLLYGELKDKSGAFRSATGTAKLNLPIFNTGYAPINLDVLAKAGKASNNIPIQYQFRPVGDIYVFKNADAIVTAPFGVYGGTEFVELHGALNINDIWWRALGLPTYYGRGIDLSLKATAAKYLNKSNSALAPTPDYLTEIGFGLSRIPTFVSNVVFLSADFFWRVGPKNDGKFGFCLGISFPF